MPRKRIKIKDQPIRVKISKQPIDVNIEDSIEISADITDRCSRLLGQLCFGGAAMDPRLVRGSQNQQLSQDMRTRDLSQIDTVHRLIHAGLHFRTTDLATGILIATPKRYLLITPNTTMRIHLSLEFVGGGAFTAELFEDTVVTANGTGMTEVNSDRNSTNVATLQTFEDPTVTADGTLIFTGSGSAIHVVDTEKNHDDEFILKQNTNYEIKITALSDGVGVLTNINWYEDG